MTSASLSHDDVELTIQPKTGGGIARFTWRGRDIFLPARSLDDPLDMSSFPLVPYSGRIANGKFISGGSKVKLPLNAPHADSRHPLHGCGWVSDWSVEKQSERELRLQHRYDGSGWFWPYLSEQSFVVNSMGYVHGLSLTNLGCSPMPAGLGLHPYFPIENARLSLDATGMWENDKSVLPSRHVALTQSHDWNDGRNYDNMFTGRSKDVVIDWPDRRLTIIADPAFAFTHVFRPMGEDYFCVEPVSHMPDAVNRVEAKHDTGLRMLAPGESWYTATRFQVEEKA